MKQNPKKIFVLTVIILMAVSLVSIQASSASKTINVPGDYSTISDAINHALDGDIIAVQSGTYHENLQVNKSISIIGENPQTTILIGEGGVDRGSKAVVSLNAENAKISGFTIKSQTYPTTGVYATGIIIKADHCTVQNNIIQNNYMGIFWSVISYTQIIGNTITGNLKDGMRCYSGSYNTISDNNIVGNAVSGLALQGYSNTVSNNTFDHNYRALGLGASYSVVFGNRMVSNTESGIWLAGTKNLIVANEISQNKYGIYITPQWAAPRDNTFYHNDFVNIAYGVFVNESTPVQYWDNGAQSGGNYWSDYQTKYPNAAEIGNSGIVNTPYLIYAGAQDNYPLIAPFDTSNLANAPSANPPPAAGSNGLAASWSFDTIDASGITADATGNNPAILGSTNGNKSYIPQTVTGEAGKALAFDGQQYIIVPSSPSLEISGEVTVDVWINVQAYKEIPYNNIIVEALRTTEALPTRTFGLAINGEAPQNDSAAALGAIRGYVYTKDGLNEIVTKNSVVQLNQWMHVVFTRSLSSGMHIYVNGEEQELKVTAGIANPQGTTLRQTETYIGHDSICTIDELKLSNNAQSTEQSMWMQWWLWTTIIMVGVFGSGIIFYGVRRSRNSKKSPHF